MKKYAVFLGQKKTGKNGNGGGISVEKLVIVCAAS